MGHSVSTWGADIDYYISGQDVEVADKPQRNYSERLLLLPGMGVIHNRPLYERTNRQKKVSEIVINFSASGQKLNARMLRTLGKLLKQVHRPVRFRFFPAVLDIQNGYLPFLAEVRAALSGTSAVLEIMPSLRYADYMGLMEEGDLALDCFHFAGCNTVADSLSLGKPTVVWEGDKWYNRIGASMLRLAGLEELIGRSEEEYLEKALRLIHDDQWREKPDGQAPGGGPGRDGVQRRRRGILPACDGVLDQQPRAAQVRTKPEAYSHSLRVCSKSRTGGEEKPGFFQKPGFWNGL